MSSDVNYALVFGNIMHNVFQAILECMDFKKETLVKIIKNSIKDQLILLYYLQKNENTVQLEVQKSIKNITDWLNLVFLPKNNKYGV
jgi:hypothetical protein